MYKYINQKEALVLLEEEKKVSTCDTDVRRGRTATLRRLVKATQGDVSEMEINVAISW